MMMRCVGVSLEDEGGGVSMRRSGWMSCALFLFAGFLTSGVAVGQDAPGVEGSAGSAAIEGEKETGTAEGGAENEPLENEMTERLDDAVEGGLAWLASQRNEDGSFGRGEYGRHVGVSSLCALAFMADGNLPGRGRYGAEVQATLEFVLRHATDSGLLAADTRRAPMYGHGFAALFLGEIYGMNPSDRRVRDALVRAVDLIVGSQNQEGGWRYNPVPYDADISVTICQIMALRSARNAGISVPKQTIDRAVQYVRECQNPHDGGFRYMRNTAASAWPRTGAGVASLFYAGVYDDEAIERGLDYLMRTALPGRTSPSQAHYYYGHYYAVQAMYLAGGAYWRQWWPAVREELLSRQALDGSFQDHYAGGSYGTAMSLIVLQMPKRYLPIFQR